MVTSIPRRPPRWLKGFKCKVPAFHKFFSQAVALVTYAVAAIALFGYSLALFSSFIENNASSVASLPISSSSLYCYILGDSFDGV